LHCETVENRSASDNLSYPLPTGRTDGEAAGCRESGKNNYPPFRAAAGKSIHFSHCFIKSKQFGNAYPPDRWHGLPNRPGCLPPSERKPFSLFRQDFQCFFCHLGKRRHVHRVSVQIVRKCFFAERAAHTFPFPE